MMITNLKKMVSVRRIIMGYLYFCRIYNSTINMCRRAYGNAAKISTFGRPRRAIKPAAPAIGPPNQEGANLRVPSHEWCPGPLCPVLVWYQRLTSLVMAYVLLINLLPMEHYLAKMMADRKLERPAHCYLLGRLILYSSLPKMMAWGCSLIHLTWRHLIMYEKCRHFHLNLVACMVQDERLIQQEQPAIARRLELGTRSGLDQYQLYLANILYQPYRIFADPGKEDKVAYLLRPNRTSEARAHLACFIKQFSLVSALMLLLAFCLISPVIYSSIFRDLAYIERYPGCSPQLEQQLGVGDGIGWSSVTLSHCHQHKLWSHLFDLAENWALWFDSATATAFTLSFTYIFNYDFLQYWQHIQRQLIQIDSQLKLNRYRHQNGVFTMDGFHQRKIFLGHRQAARRRRRLNGQRKLELSICRVQAQLIDFFHQLRAVDELVSDILTMSLVIWFSLFSLGTLYFLRHGPSQVAIELRLIQLVALLALVVENMYLLSLRRALSRSHTTVCSIMAHDQSRYKGRFVKILELWEWQSSWTLFHRYAFTPTTSLTLIGWSMSLIIASENMTRG